jgi:SSS family solute:Na+ symporter
MAISYGATFISTSAIVGFGGAAAVYGMGLLWLTVLNVFMGIFVAFVVFGKRTRAIGHKIDAHTFPEFLSKRFDSPFIQKFAGIVIFVFMPLYAAAVLIGAAKFIEMQFNINYGTALLFFTLIVASYVIMGGLKAVMYTDAFQGGIMFIGMTVLMVSTYWIMGGITEAHSSLTAMQAPAPLAAKGHAGWTSMPAIGSEFWWNLVSTIIMGVGIGVLAQPQLVVRFMTVKSNRELNRAVLVGGVFILMMTGVAFTTGALSNVFFSKNMNNAQFCEITGSLSDSCPGTMKAKVNDKNLEAASKIKQNVKIGDTVDFHAGIPHKITNKGSLAIKAAGGDVQEIIPQYIKQAMPPWFGILFLLTLLSAAMSTLSAQFHTLGTALGRDIYEQFEKGKKFSSERSMYISKIGIAVTILISAFLAYILPIVIPKGEAIIARGTAIFFATCACGFLPMYAGGLYSKKITKAGAIAGMTSGVAVSLFWLVFVHLAESSVIGLSYAITGKQSIFGAPWNLVDPLFIGLPVSIILTVVVSMFSKKFSDEHIKKIFSSINK